MGGVRLVLCLCLCWNLVPGQPEVPDGGVADDVPKEALIDSETTESEVGKKVVLAHPGGILSSIPAYEPTPKRFTEALPSNSAPVPPTVLLTQTSILSRAPPVPIAPITAQTNSGTLGSVFDRQPNLVDPTEILKARFSNTALPKVFNTFEHLLTPRMAQQFNAIASPLIAKLATRNHAERGAEGGGSPHDTQLSQLTAQTTTEAELQGYSDSSSSSSQSSYSMDEDMPSSQLSTNSLGKDGSLGGVFTSVDSGSSSESSDSSFTSPSSASSAPTDGEKKGNEEQGDTDSPSLSSVRSSGVESSSNPSFHSSSSAGLAYYTMNEIR